MIGFQIICHITNFCYTVGCRIFVDCFILLGVECAFWHLICMNWHKDNETTPDWRDLPRNLKTAQNRIAQRLLTSVYILLCISKCFLRYCNLFQQPCFSNHETSKKIFDRSIERYIRPDLPGLIWNWHWFFPFPGFFFKSYYKYPPTEYNVISFDI